MTIVLGALAYLTAYFALGWWLAKRDLPRAWAAARKEHGDPNERVAGELNQKFALGDVKAATTITLFFWPVALPARAFNGAITRTATGHDPREQEKRLRAQADRIRELERELGIK
ncbi:hypothetical protein [Nocardiopsis ganjiahuensis]|uniref:hypothetical protein n=1 Tax=Nocardiopsis ganjiahuensis TaxID=239984 RepID=UPI000349D65D|nr:hypothetical protein [Nocardiopsis ganjiahuensis]